MGFTTGATPTGIVNEADFVNLSRTGAFATGQSGLAGSSTYTRYSKLFFYHAGTAGDTLTNPQVFLTNESVSDQVTFAPDAYFIDTDSFGGHGLQSQTGTATGRSVRPEGLLDSHFSGYSVSNPLNFSDLPRGTITLDSGDFLGVWLRLQVPPGLQEAREASFNLGIRGEIDP